MLTEWLTITAIATLGIISPGPGFAVAFRNSVSFGRHVGLGTALGIACGDLIHVLVNLLGVLSNGSIYTTSWWWLISFVFGHKGTVFKRP